MVPRGIQSTGVGVTLLMKQTLYTQATMAGFHGTALSYIFQYLSYFLHLQYKSLSWADNSILNMLNWFLELLKILFLLLLGISPGMGAWNPMHMVPVAFKQQNCHYINVPSIKAMAHLNHSTIVSSVVAMTL